MNAGGKLGAIVIVVIIGLWVHAKWTGQPLRFNVLGPNQIGTAINEAQAQRIDQALTAAAQSSGAPAGAVALM